LKARGVCCASATAALRACARAPGTRALARAAHTRPQSPTTQWWAPPCEAASLPPPRAASACLFASTAFVITRCFCGAARERERERAAMRLGSAAAAGARSRAHQLVAMQALEVVGPLQHARRRRRRRRHAVAEAAPEPVAQRGLAEGAGAGGHVRGGRACGGGMRRRCGGAWPHVTVELVDAAGRWRCGRQLRRQRLGRARCMCECAAGPRGSTRRRWRPHQRRRRAVACQQCCLVGRGR